MIVSVMNSPIDFFHGVIANNDDSQNYFRDAPIVWLNRESSKNETR